MDFSVPNTSTKYYNVKKVTWTSDLCLYSPTCLRFPTELCRPYKVHAGRKGRVAGLGLQVETGGLAGIAAAPVQSYDFDLLFSAKFMLYCMQLNFHRLEIDTQLSAKMQTILLFTCKIINISITSWLPWHSALPWCRALWTVQAASASQSESGTGCPRQSRSGNELSFPHLLLVSLYFKSLFRSVVYIVILLSDIFSKYWSGRCATNF